LRFPLSILACLIAAYALGFYLAVPANPEVKFWNEVVELRDKEIKEVRKAQPDTPILFFTGGSSCAFSIDPAIIEETCGMPAFNLGLPVAAGPKYLFHQALEKANRGDFIVICLEPDLLTFPEDFKASQFSFAMASSKLNPASAGGGSSFGSILGPREYLNLSRPGPGYVATWLGKAATGKGYRYTPEDIKYHGRVETAVTNPMLPLSGPKSVTQICSTGQNVLVQLKSATAQKGVHIVYSMPWILSEKNAASTSRTANLRILESINAILPAIDDGHQGISTDHSHFSDSSLHLSARGSALRSKALGDALQTWLASHR
jgi:hypothetical protein